MLLALLAATTGAAHADGEGITCVGALNRDTGKSMTVELKREIGVPLDDTGIADQRLVNPRRPLSVLQLVSGNDLGKESADIWRDCAKWVRELKIVLINRTARSFGLQFNIIVSDAKVEVWAAYKNLLVQMERKSGPNPAANEADQKVWQALKRSSARSSSEDKSCQGAIARLDPAPSGSQVAKLKWNCVTRVQLLLDEWMPRPATAKTPEEAAILAVHEAVDEMSSVTDRVERSLTVLDANAEVGAAYKDLLVQVERKPGSNPAANEEVLQALERSEDKSCQGAIARLGRAPSQPQVAELKRYCVTDVKPLLDRAVPQPLKTPQDEAILEVREAMDGMSSTIDRVERSLGPAVNLPPGDCKYDTATSALRCSVKIIVPPGGRVPVPQAIMTYPPQNGVLSFTASFADTADIPSNSTGYLQMAKEVEEAPDSTQWRYSAQLGASWDPDTGKVAEMKAFSPNQPYAGETLQHFVGAGNLKISQRLGNRASASATLGFKKGDLGEKDTTRQVTVPEYALNLYGEGGEQLLFGKYTLAAPSSGIAVNVVGEGFEVRNGTFSIGYLIQRESTTGEAEHSNRDNRLIIAQMKNRPFFKQGQPFFRTLTLVGLYGSEGAARLTVPNSSSNPLPDDPACENPAPATGSTPATRQLCYGYRYWTGGFELSFAHEAPPALSPSTYYPWSVSGTLSGYYSGRDLNSSAVNHIADRVKEGRGGTGLANVNFIRFRKTDGHQEGLEQEYLVGLQVGYGTGNNPAHTKVDRGYLGESTAFDPDQIFLSRLAGRLTDRAASASGPEPVSLVQPGLSNKLYEGITFTYNHPSPGSGGFESPLWYLVNSLFRGDTKPVSQLTTFRIHNYSFNEPVFGRREAGTELGLELSMEVPKGITTTVDFGKLLVGSALRPVISKDPWLATATIKVDL